MIEYERRTTTFGTNNPNGPNGIINQATSIIGGGGGGGGKNHRMRYYKSKVF